jgi:flagellar biosynthesis GTPase FlhF
MNLQTFKAPTMAEALTQVKREMWVDAVILHTRTFQTRYWLGLRRREMVEITAGKGLNIGAGRRRPPAAAPAEPKPAAPPSHAPSPPTATSPRATPSRAAGPSWRRPPPTAPPS